MNWPTINFGCDWLQFLSPRRFNWINFTVINIEPEWDRSLGDISIRLGLFGLRFSVSWNYEAETVLRNRLSEMMADFMENTHVTLSRAEYDALKSGKSADNRPAYLADFGANNVPVEDLGAEPMGWEKAP